MRPRLRGLAWGLGPLLVILNLISNVNTCSFSSNMFTVYACLLYDVVAVYPSTVVSLKSDGFPYSKFPYVADSPFFSFETRLNRSSCDGLPIDSAPVQVNDVINVDAVAISSSTAPLIVTLRNPISFGDEWSTPLIFIRYI